FISEDTYQAPTTELEIELCNIFAEVLGLDKVGVNDNFFRIGGNSILAIKLANKISKVLKTNVNVADVFSYKDVSKLSDYLLDSTIEGIQIPKLGINYNPLSFAQERLWFIEQYEKGSNAYHIPILVFINEGVDIGAIKDSL
ncbi:phosphopantetheine-binding protein, partial [Francisella philomiragia]|uniref:phosphopantetheine-binding protein n=1 Tax=Francisella philomiragia TaxID=28110 RepID=UPI0019076517